MRNDTHTYPTYKLCSIPQICQIPSHWEVKRLAQMGTFSKGGGGTKDDEAEHGLPCIRYGDIYTSHKYFATQSRSRIHPDRAPNYARIKYGDVLFAGSGETIEDIGKSVVSLIEEEAYCGGDVILFRPTVQVHPRFMGYTLDSPPFAFQKSSMGRGITIMHIYSSQLKNMCIPLPPLDEQAAIVRYLDHADELISRYISAKERLIALLEEQRQAVIHQAVTRGLDPNVPLKLSAIPQIDEIPTQWNARRLRRLANIRFSNVDKHTQDDEIPVELCNYVDVYKNDHITKHIPFMKATAGQKEIDRFRLQLEDVLITKDSEVWNDIGVPSLVKHTDEHLICGYHVAMLRPSPTVLCGRYLLRLLQDAAISYQFHIEANGVTRFGLSQDSIKSVIIPTPPVQEQETIADFLDTQTTNIQTGIERCHRQIGLIREYHSRLIADVVTGQIDVRDAAVELPGQHL